jgi:hypothetical protein
MPSPPSPPPQPPAGGPPEARVPGAHPRGRGAAAAAGKGRGDPGRRHRWAALPAGARGGVSACGAVVHHYVAKRAREFLRSERRVWWSASRRAADAGLLDMLSGERERWGAQLGALAAGLRSLPLEALLAAAAVVHLGGAPEDERAEATAEWAE